MTAVAIYCLIGTMVGWLIGDRKGRPEFGAVMGFFFGPLGWLVVAMSERAKKVIVGFFLATVLLVILAAISSHQPVVQRVPDPTPPPALVAAQAVAPGAVAQPTRDYPPALIASWQKAGIPESHYEKLAQQVLDITPRQSVAHAVIVQHLQNGDLLVNVDGVRANESNDVRMGDYAVYGYDGAGEVADGDSLKNLPVIPVGTIQYVTTSGATRTIYELSCFSDDSQSQDAGASQVSNQEAPTPTPEPLPLDFHQWTRAQQLDYLHARYRH